MIHSSEKIQFRHLTVFTIMLLLFLCLTACRSNSSSSAETSVSESTTESSSVSETVEEDQNDVEEGIAYLKSLEGDGPVADDDQLGEVAADSSDEADSDYEQADAESTDGD